MRLHEYEAKGVFKKDGIPVAEGKVAFSSKEAVEIAKKIVLPVVIKAQVLVGGRGRAGGVKFARNLKEVEEITSKMLEVDIKGYKIEGVLIEKKLNIQKELYLGVTIEGSAGKPVVIVSSEGGVEIEETARNYPQKIFSLPVDVFKGLRPYEALLLAKKLGLKGKKLLKVGDILYKLGNLYRDYDALIAEINPLVVTKEGEIFAADAVLQVDDSSLFRHPELRAKAIERIPDELEREAKKVGVTYVNLDGDIGLICSGAGLGMATMDMIRKEATPANFLETGGGMTKELMAGALRVIMKKKNIRAVFINVYGGINPIHEGAKGIVEVIKEDKIKVPIVAKALGNRQEETWGILEEGGVKVVKESRTSKAVEELFKALREKE
ncbi:MAG: ADP-forming succinate--CoA ligase subunit beta [Candidatus Aerophobetes bacterium]|nr:ADP-forming succinate--CoA ligase subunit beta [Candidatus Aerophobetes bacterium]